MRSSTVEILHVLLKHSVQLTFVDNQHVIETLSASTPQKPFTNRICLGCSYRCSENLDAAGGARKFRAELAVVITDQKPRVGVEGGGFAQLLGNPSITWGVRDGKMNDPARTQLDDDEDEDRAKPEVVSLKEITSPDLRCVIGEKGGPRLSAAPRGLGASHLSDVFGNSPLAETKAQLTQLILNALGPP